MFEYKHKIELSTFEKIYLNGEDFFGDKSTFWNVHQTNLEYLCKKVCTSGFPITITDIELNKITTIQNQEEFDFWLNENQPYKCDCFKYPSYKEGQKALDELCRKGKACDGILTIELTISKNGKVSNIELLKALGKTNIEWGKPMLSKMTDWIPAKIDNEYVESKIQILLYTQ